MKRIIFAMFMVCALIVSVPVNAEAATYAKGIILDGQQIETEIAPIIENGRTLVPVRGVLEAMGATVAWDQATKTATAYLGENTTSVTIDNYTAYVNGYAVTLEVPAKVVNGRTMVPLRFMAEAIGYDVSYSDGYVYLDMPQYDGYSEFYAIMDDFDVNIVQPEFQLDNLYVSTSYNEDENAVVISIQGDGMANEIMKMTTNEGFESEWSKFVDDIGILSLAIGEYFDAYGYDVNGIVEIINDEDSEYVLLQINNGVVTYDETGLY